MNKLKILSRKMLILCIIIGVLLLNTVLLITTIAEVAEESKEQSLKGRLQLVEKSLSKGDIVNLRYYLTKKACTENEFEYAWERLYFYDNYNLYYLYANASENDAENKNEFYQKSIDYKDACLAVCENSIYDQNEAMLKWYKTLLP